MRSASPPSPSSPSTSCPARSWRRPGSSSRPRRSAARRHEMFDMRLNSHSRLNLITALLAGDRGRRRRGADARPAGLRLELQRHQLLLRAGRQRADLDRRVLLQRRHARARHRALPRGAASRSSCATSAWPRRTPPTRPSSPAPSAASRRCARSTVTCLPAALARPGDRAAARAVRRSAGRRSRARGRMSPAAGPHRHVVGPAQHLHRHDALLRPARRHRRGRRAVLRRLSGAVSGQHHPMREEVLASQPQDWRARRAGAAGAGARMGARSITRST